jgi:prephenate dehydrogenase
VTVIGVGLIGGSLCAGLTRNGLRVRGVSSGGTLEKALRMGIIERGYGYEEQQRAVEGSDFVFLCTPLQDITRRVEPVLACAGRNAVVTDVGSTKGVVAGIAERCAGNGAHFIGGHPMTGGEKRGVEQASPFLFYDAVYVLTPLRNTPRRATRRLGALLAGLGAKIMILTPDLHDRIAADVSHLPQMLAVLLTNHLAGRGDDLFRNLAAGGFRDMTRIASSSYQVWRDILGTNRGEIRRALEEYRDDLDELIRRLDQEAYLEELFERAARERAVIPRYDRGFLKPLFDLRISVKDRPGELARVTSMVYYNGVNIRDIEIVSVREGEGGILRLGFADRRDAEKAAAALQGVGYQVSLPE